MSPIVGITCNFADGDARLARAYYSQVEAAGGVPLLLPPVEGSEAVARQLDAVDALLLSGGADINPLLLGEEPSPLLHAICPERDEAELEAVRTAWRRQIPMLGICRGIQTIAAALGGHVAQDISLVCQQPIRHSQDAPRHTKTHTVRLAEGSRLASVYGDTATLQVNSFHHQVVDRTGPHLKVAATSPDGLIEALESTEHKPVMAVQWHPECLADDGLPLFRWLVSEARLHRRCLDLHERTLTLDSHCDTPMFFAQGADITRRDPLTLVSLPRMQEGHLDATVMVAYLPQPKLGETFSSKIDAQAPTPAAYADLQFDRIETQVAQAPQLLSIARTPADLYADKRAGRHSIMLGIENGLALEGNPALVKHFRQRGVVYITLCHNGDNDLCDSARGSATHGGLSRTGRRVVEEMNRQGIIIDLSHAAESTFYDTMMLSTSPVVCSHSSCRALCDHPRNLTDDQLRTLARHGGVCQLTLYPGFLAAAQGGRQAAAPTEADIHTFMAHLDHAVRVCGIDHVGFGSDFDGDGGIPGLASASEALLFTRQLLLRRYSETDIAKIWGQNFLRVMTQVQARS